MRRFRAKPVVTGIIGVGDSDTLPPPETPSANLLLNLQADILPLGTLSTWSDTSGNNNHFTQSGDARPTVVNLGGYKAVEFDGVDDFMEGTDFADNLSAFACFVLFRESLGTEWDFLVKSDELYTDPLWAFGNQVLQISQQQNVIRLAISNGGLQEIDVDHLVVGEKFDNTDGNFFVDGSDVGDNVSLLGTITSFSNAFTVKLGLYGWYHIRAVMIYQITDVVNWATDRAAITTWLAARYGITL